MPMRVRSADPVSKAEGREESGERAEHNHIGFYELLSSVDIALSEARSPRGWQRLVEYIEELYEETSRHVHYEERSGMFDRMRSRLPREAAVIDELERGHIVLLAELEGIRNTVTAQPDVTSPDPVLTARMGAWLTDLYAHEDRELALLERSNRSR